jgi:lipoate-protein ligase A
VARRFRVLLAGAAGGPWNMGADEALLASVEAGGAPALRLYGWEGPWLSLGRGQPVPAARLSACREAGVGVVRRRTGGGAVLHGRDLTYAFAAPARELPGAIRDAYAAIAEALVDALVFVGVPVERVPVAAAPRGISGAFDCFAEAAGDEIRAGGRKLVGSAQRRTVTGVLQHGSIRLARDPEAAARAAGLDPERATDLSTLGFPDAGAALREALLGAFAERFDAEWEASRLTPGEMATAAARTSEVERPPGKPPSDEPVESSRAGVGDR